MRSQPERKTRVITQVGKISQTDQSAKKSTCINTMMKKFSRTGIAPIPERHGIFADISEVKTLSEMYELSNVAIEAFQSLPARVRSLMNNDPSKLEEFILNKKNLDLCIENGLLQPEKVEKPKKPQEVVIVETKSSKDDK